MSMVACQNPKSSEARFVWCGKTTHALLDLERWVYGPMIFKQKVGFELAWFGTWKGRVDWVGAIPPYK